MTRIDPLWWIFRPKNAVRPEKEDDPMPDTLQMPGVCRLCGDRADDQPVVTFPDGPAHRRCVDRLRFKNIVEPALMDSIRRARQR